MAMNQPARRPVENQEEHEAVQPSRDEPVAALRPVSKAAGHCFEHCVTVGTKGALRATIDARTHQCQRDSGHIMQPDSRADSLIEACFEI